MKKTITIIAAALVAATSAAAAPAGQHARYDRVQTVKMRIGPTPGRWWVSAEREPQTIPFSVESVRVNGRNVPFFGEKGCRARMYGAGAVVEITSCGRRARLRFRGVALEPSTLVIRYVAPSF